MMHLVCYVSTPSCHHLTGLCYTRINIVSCLFSCTTKEACGLSCDTKELGCISMEALLGGRLLRMFSWANLHAMLCCATRLFKCMDMSQFDTATDAAPSAAPSAALYVFLSFMRFPWNVSRIFIYLFPMNHTL